MNSETIDDNEQGFSGISVYACEYLSIMICILMRGVENWGINTKLFLECICFFSYLKGISWMDGYKGTICDDPGVSDIFLIFRKKRKNVDFI